MLAEALTQDELFELTSYKQGAAQRRALQRLGIPFKPRPRDGFPLVARVAVVHALAGQKLQATPAAADDEPKFDQVV
jgi:hypothetical protein